MELRPAAYSDEALLYAWRTDDEQADWYGGDPVTRREHDAWLRVRLDPFSLVHIWIAEVDGRPVGQARLDSNGELAFSIDKHHRGNGYGTELVKLATKAAKKRGWKRVKVNVDLGNEASVRTLKAAGYDFRPDVGFMRWPS